MTRTMRALSLIPALALALTGAACGDDDDDDVMPEPDAGVDAEVPEPDAEVPQSGQVAGTVTDADGVPLEGASVTADPGMATVMTDAQGRYSLDLDQGTYRIEVVLEDYVTVERGDIAVTAGGSVTLDFALEPAVGTATLQVNDLCGDGGLGGVAIAEASPLGTTDASGQAVIEGLAPGEHILSLEAQAYLPVQVTVNVVAGESTPSAVDMTCQTKAVGDLARAFFATINQDFNGVTSALALHTNLYDGDASNDPTVISVRSPEHYALGHVPGAINIPWKTVANDPIGLLGEPNDPDRTFVDYCYTGHTGAIAAGILNVLGYRTSNMKFGIVSWTPDVTVRASGIEPAINDNDFATETEANVPVDTFEPPWLDYPDVTTAWEAAQAAAQAYLGSDTIAPTIAAADLFNLLNDGDESNDPFIISVRAADHYALGHIPGAVNIPYATIANEESLAMIPPDRDIVVYCYTGHTGGIATGVLGMLGYQNVRNLKFGIHAWTQDATVRGNTPFSADTDVHDYPLNAGVDP